MNTPTQSKITITKQENGWACAVGPAGTSQATLMQALEAYFEVKIPEDSELCNVEEVGGSIVFYWLVNPTAV
ncbi:MAG: hypothetical protein Q7K43_06260 [Candidatus Woesearchaeota archaeon]|nr:hypothetical protein [Candidatus Woesearchaeota archaeon]